MVSQYRRYVDESVVILGVDDCPERDEVEVDLSNFFLFFLTNFLTPCLSFDAWQWL